MKSINFTDPKMVKIFDAVVNHCGYEAFMNAFEWKTQNGLTMEIFPTLERNPNLDLETQSILRTEMTICEMYTTDWNIDINEETNELMCCGEPGFNDGMFHTYYLENKEDYEENVQYMNFEYSPERSDYESMMECQRVYKEAGKMLFS